MLNLKAWLLGIEHLHFKSNTKYRTGANLCGMRPVNKRAYVFIKQDLTVKSVRG